MGTEVMAFDAMEKMAVAVAKTRMWKGIDTPEKALSLMMLCQAEGLHPMTAVRRYDIIDGGAPTLKSEALLAEFYSRGGAVVWIQRTAEACEAKFIHPKNCPQGVVIKWTLADAAKAGLAGKFNWRAYPRQMLCARVVSEGVQVADPGAGLGMLTTEEAIDVRGHWADQAAAMSSELTGEPTEAIQVEQEAQPTIGEKEFRNVRAELNKALQECKATPDFRGSCKAFQDKYGKGVWSTLTRHNAEETFGSLAQTHRERIASAEHFVSPAGMAEWRARLAEVTKESEFRQFEATINAYPEYYGNQDNHDALAKKAREIGIPEYAIED